MKVKRTTGIKFDEEERPNIALVVGVVEELWETMRETSTELLTNGTHTLTLEALDVCQEVLYCFQYDTEWKGVYNEEQ